MAGKGEDNNVGNRTGQYIPVGGRMPITPPASADIIRKGVIETKEDMSQSNTPTMEQEQAKENVHLATEDRTPKPENPLYMQAPMSESVQHMPGSHLQGDENIDRPTPGIGDCFALAGSNVADFALATNPASGLSRVGSSPGNRAQHASPGQTSPRSVSPDSSTSSWKDFSTQTVIGPGFPPGGNRPTSVPNFQTKPISRRREGPEYPTYPDQSFKALQSQQYPPSYHPGSPHPLRTRSSHPPQNIPLSSPDCNDISGTPQPSSGAKTVGNTPAQSPGLFSPMFPVKKPWPGESDDGRSSTPMLHPSHHKEPKETHKLTKDIDPISGRKTVNHYEILQKLGSGQHGTVKKGRDLNTGEMVAIKIVRRFSKKLRLGKTGDPNDMIRKEVAILKKARHPHVVSLIEVIDDDEFGKVYLVLEFVKRGEIIWRKQTDKDIALFEMERTKREYANNVDEFFEKHAVESFNRGAPSRRLEKARLLETQKRQARERFESEGYQLHQAPLLDPYWSLEFADESENDIGAESPVQATIQLGGLLPPGERSPPALTGGGSPQSDTPSHTPKPLPNPIEPQQMPVSASSSRPATPGNLEGTMWGPYIEESASDLALKTTLDQIIAVQTHWTPEEEDFRYVPCLTLSQALDAFRDTVLGLEYLHYQGIIHRDIKPANLLWTNDYRVKISDFGVSYLGKPIREDDNKEEIPEADSAILDEAIELAKTVGTPAFYAPELCDPQYFEIGKLPERPAITGQIDVWALGVTLYAMIFGRLPFVHTNEFQMYEKIAREEVFIPRMRLRGVEHTDKTPSNQNKRLDDILEYEEVEDELRDLLKRLLHKHPSKRITLKEVKHHPWVLKGIADGSIWIDETDPSVQSQGRKIEVSTQEVQDAVVGLNFVDRVKLGFQRVGSVLRGRGSRNRADSNPKAPESASSTSTSKSSGGIRDQRRPSLRGDEQIYSALRASRENSEHPLAQSLAASPETNEVRSYFEESGGLRPASEPQPKRPSLPDRVLSTADSMKTIRPPVSSTIKEFVLPPHTSSPAEDLSTTTPVVDPNSSSSSLGGIFGGAGRRFVNSMRSRERSTGRQSPSQSSRSSSVDTNLEDPHASPSLALSSVIAAGHVGTPSALSEEAEWHRPESRAESFQRAHEDNYRRATREHMARTGRRSTVSQAGDMPCPPSPDDAIFFAQQRPPSATDSVSMFPNVSSSSDQIVSGESTAHSRIPSVVSGASSLSATVEEGYSSHAHTLEKSISPLTIGRSGSQTRHSVESLNPRPALAKAAAEEEAGYNGEGEQDDSDSEDEGLAMA